MTFAQTIVAPLWFVFCLASLTGILWGLNHTTYHRKRFWHTCCEYKSPTRFLISLIWLLSASIAGLSVFSFLVIFYSYHEASYWGSITSVVTFAVTYVVIMYTNS